jgi:hypothetical protein
MDTMKIVGSDGEMGFDCERAWVGGDVDSPAGSSLTMWIALQLGFFSVVTKSPGEFQIRARVKGD